MEQTVTVTIETLNAVLAYLGNRPFNEVVALISAVHQQVKPQLEPNETPVQDPQ